MDTNPFTYLPVNMCGDPELPEFPVIQDCVSYSQYRSEICGILIRPFSALTPPVLWRQFSAWSSRIDNADPAETHYIVGRGGFLQSSAETVSLADGRLVENRERVQRLSFSVLNMNEGHADFGRSLQSNYKGFYFWLHTVDNRVMGGSSGMRPIFVDAEFPFAPGKDSRETMNITIDTEFINAPEW